MPPSRIRSPLVDFRDFAYVRACMRYLSLLAGSRPCEEDAHGRPPLTSVRRAFISSRRRHREDPRSPRPPGGALIIARSPIRELFIAVMTAIRAHAHISIIVISPPPRRLSCRVFVSFRGALGRVARVIRRYARLRLRGSASTNS